MELDSKTPYPAHFCRAAIGDDRFAASILARGTFDVGARGAAASEPQRWTTSRAPFPSPQGEMASDDVYYREGGDVLLFGSARPADGKPAREGTVAVTVGELSRRVRVFGDRTWIVWLAERLAGVVARQATLSAEGRSRSGSAARAARPNEADRIPPVVIPASPPRRQSGT